MVGSRLSLLQQPLSVHVIVMLLLACRRCRYLSLLSSLLFDRTLYSQALRTLADEIRRWFVVGTNKHCVSAWASLVVMLKGLAVKSVAALAQKTKLSQAVEQKDWGAVNNVLFMMQAASVDMTDPCVLGAQQELAAARQAVELLARSAIAAGSVESLDTCLTNMCHLQDSATQRTWKVFREVLRACQMVDAAKNPGLGNGDGHWAAFQLSQATADALVALAATQTALRGVDASALDGNADAVHSTLSDTLAKREENVARWIGALKAYVQAPPSPVLGQAHTDWLSHLKRVLSLKLQELHHSIPLVDLLAEGDHCHAAATAAIEAPCFCCCLAAVAAAAACCCCCCCGSCACSRCCC